MASNPYPQKNQSVLGRLKPSISVSSFQVYRAATILFAEIESRRILQAIRGSSIPIAERDPSRRSASQ